jgi:hypothetical protein
MVELTHEQMVEVATVDLTSNTPFYFFDNLRKTNAVQHLAAIASTADLVESVDFLLAQRSTREESILTLFSLIGALSLKPSSVSPDYFSGIDLSHLRWGSKFIYFASSYLNNDTHRSWTIEPLPKAPEVSEAVAKPDSNNQTLVF